MSGSELTTSITEHTAIQPDVRARPNYAAPIYVAYDALKAAGYKPELHLHEHGGHGWNMRKQGATSDHWPDEFYWWLETHELTKPGK